jgi:hypothetical protein
LGVDLIAFLNTHSHLQIHLQVTNSYLYSHYCITLQLVSSSMEHPISAPIASEPIKFFKLVDSYSSCLLLVRVTCHPKTTMNNLPISSSCCLITHWPSRSTTLAFHCSCTCTLYYYTSLWWEKNNDTLKDSKLLQYITI